MSIATEISRLQTAKADIKAALESKTIAVSSTLKIDEYVQLINKYLVKDTRVVAKFNVTSTSSPTPIGYSTSGFSAIEIDGVELPSVVSAYTFSTKGTHTVKYTLTDPTTISVSAFTDCTTLTSVSIPNSVTSIGYSAFYDCRSITSINIPSGVTSIGDRVFGAGTILSMVVDSGNTVYDSRNNCNAIIRKSDNQLVVGCKNTVIPNTVTSIGANAFFYCRNLTSITIPNTVTSIGINAFYNCRNLTSINIPDSVTSIDDNAFAGCGGLTSITVDSNNTTFDSRNSCNAIIKKSNNELITGCKNTVIPNTVTSIGNYAFYYCTSLTNISIPSSVTSIGNNAFSTCRNLTSINIPSGVTAIGTAAFSDCSGLTSITVDSNNITFDSRNNCNAIIKKSNNELIAGCKNTVIPNTVTRIGNYAFYYYTSLTSISMPSSITSIGQYAFGYCTGLTNVTIPSSVTSIEVRAFRGCSSLTSITSNAMTAPTISSNTFQDVKTGGTLYVPQGSSGYDVWMGTGNYYLGKYNWTKVTQ